MTAAELDGAVTSFIESVCVALSEAPTSSYATTVLTVSPSGDLCFNLLVVEDRPAEVDRAALAFEFGKALWRDHPSVAAVIVGEEMVGELDAPWLVVTAATVQGERRTTCMKMN